MQKLQIDQTKRSNAYVFIEKPLNIPLVIDKEVSNLVSRHSLLHYFARGQKICLLDHSSNTSVDMRNWPGE